MARTFIEWVQQFEENITFYAEEVIFVGQGESSQHGQWAIKAIKPGFRREMTLPVVSAKIISPNQITHQALFDKLHSEDKNVPVLFTAFDKRNYKTVMPLISFKVLLHQIENAQSDNDVGSAYAASMQTQQNVARNIMRKSG